ncbi:trace amine-associated receptor 3-like [Ambystoma mexicanum]|uniref:trace amine-associated receptor 3-like n=1 Tax=Ambystoma mexicanum TaxID=8296 RepID=UPI0037E864C8
MDISDSNKVSVNCSQFGNYSSPCPSHIRPLSVQALMYCFLIISIMITVFGNLAMMVSISHFKQLHSPTNFLILSMAATDFLVGFIIMPYSLVRSVGKCWPFGDMFCRIHYSFDLMLSVISIFHLCSIAVDRFYAVCDPLHYSNKMTMPVIRGLVVFCWSVPAIFAFGVVITDSHVSGIEGYELLVACFSLCPITFNRLWSIVMFIACFFAPGSVMVGIYVKIFVVSKKHAQIISKMSAKSDDETNHNLSKKTDRKAAKTLGIVMGVFLSCWLPVFIVILIDPFLKFSTPEDLFDALNWLGYINSTCNPLIYGFFYPWFRKSLRYIISGKIFDPHSCTAKMTTENH